MKPAPFHSGLSPASPEHVAIILDGNGRWAKAHNLPRVAGHQRGAEAVRQTVKASVDLGISYLTLYGFSNENWKRPTREVANLMGLLRLYLRKEIAELDDQGVRIRFIGDRDRLANDIVSLIEIAEHRTKDNGRLNLVVAISYGSRQEITNAARRLVHEALDGYIDPSSIDEYALNDRLATAGMPDPDLLIRTSGEHRISNFLLWQSAYAELVFVDTLWPDFSKSDLEDAVREFQRRERRFGATGG